MRIRRPELPAWKMNMIIGKNVSSCKSVLQTKFLFRAGHVQELWQEVSYNRFLSYTVDSIDPTKSQ
jgi:hypothetical protein